MDQIKIKQQKDISTLNDLKQKLEIEKVMQASE